MKILIIEDEIPAQRYLKKTVQTLLPEAEFLFPIQSVEEGLEFFKEENTKIDLIFSDIQLTDGESFDIFKEVEIDVPIIFVTAYNQYALKAFEVNSIDYILKPFDEENIQNAIDKFQTRKSAPVSKELISSISDTIQNQKEVYRKRIWVNLPINLSVLKVDEINCFYSKNKVVHVLSNSDLNATLDLSLDKLEDQLDPKDFFRVNRQFIVQINAVKSIEPYYNGKWVLRIKGFEQEEIIIPKEKVSKFKQWVVKTD
ncbi:MULTISPECIES: LytR/AlgR family response regulator transcription factor [Flammeovirga]|uniref:Response regulator transcription factor n=1 Tax=Flammeovirga agarivorans TaxID=2726742 RepID=A0A7X8SNM5_9BACT|nr:MULTISPECIES: LytTR family DNA-binding domain-containing protein [Flammeovirga]NLR93536.1 response regulator transcription factor [Flammeovirga agarivorans]